MEERSTESVPPDEPSAQILAAWPAGRVVAGRYEIGPVLGVGGSSVIYRAFDRTLKQSVALKVLRRDRVSPAATGRLRREVAVARNAASPHLVRVFDIGVADDDTFVTMELVEGESLRRKLERGPLSVAETLDFAKQLLRGLAALHEQNTIHRDIKPSNVLIDANGVVKLADFGLAVDPNADGDRPTQTGTLVGTAEYMSPEQVTGALLDARSDLYSFGVLVYECLTGDLPFGSRSSVAALLAHVHERPRSVRALRPDVPKWLSRLVDRLLAKDAELRFGSAEKVLSLIEEERAPHNWKPAGAVAVATALVLVALVAAAGLWPPPRKFDHLASTGRQRGIEAVDQRGEVLWRNANTDLRHSALVHFNGKTRIATIERIWEKTSAEARSKVLLLDPITGRVDSSVVLLSPAAVTFPQYPDLFTSMQLVAIDFDDDGNDEIVVPYVHAYWPSYTVVYDLGERIERLFYVHSGHAPIIGAADVNGDGRDELIIGGINNRMGWYNSVAALDVPRASGKVMTSTVFVTCSPDAVYSNSDQRKLLWYELMPPEFLAGDAIRVNKSARTISLRYTSRPEVVVTYAGFRTDSPSSLPPAQRGALRNDAYEMLRQVARLMTAGEYNDAEHRATAALQLASKTADPSLQEWAQRVHMRTLVHLGRIHEAEAIGDALLTSSSAIADCAWDLAHELHVSGHPDAAFVWYRRGLSAGRDVNAGRMRYEFVQGAVFALVEQKRWVDANAFLDEARRILPNFVEELQYVNYIRWRRGESTFIPTDTNHADVDLSRYWALEEKHVAGLRGASLLSAVNVEEKITSYTGLVLSLKAVALDEAGDHADARRLAAAALEWCNLRSSTDVAIHAHLDIVRERARKLGAMSD